MSASPTPKQQDEPQLAGLPEECSGFLTPEVGNAASKRGIPPAGRPSPLPEIRVEAFDDSMAGYGGIG